jgi:hypothetical protein
MFQSIMSIVPRPEHTLLQQNLSDIIRVDDPMAHSVTTGNTTSVHLVPFKMPRAPPHVYSCFVVNRTDEPIECTLKYDGRSGEDKFDQVINVTIPANSEHYFPRQFFQPDLPESYCKWVKVVTHIRVKKLDGKILKANYPFEHVHCPIRNWEFHVTDDGDVLSKPPTRVVNVLKYENLDQYEC